MDTGALLHLSQAIRMPTVSFDNDSTVINNYSAIDSLISFLKNTYPQTFSVLDDTLINAHSILLHWRSAHPGNPVILYAHMDVVPADAMRWNRPPFGGTITADSVYGRGAVDDKGSIIAIMEAVEHLVQDGFTPHRDIYVAFGHDEESDGDDGAKKIAEYLKSRNVEAEFMLDEGGLVAINMVPFVKAPVAMIFTAEKGYMTAELSVNGNGGHSSHPPRQGPVEILSAAITQINSHPFGVRFTGAVNDFLDYTGPEMKMPFKALFANRWLFGSLIENEYNKIPSAAAMIHTTAVTTVINGGQKENVVPSDVTAKINIRLLPGDSSKMILDKLKKIINDDRVAVKILPNVIEASPVSSVETPSFNLLRVVINQVFPDAVVSPSLLIAQTDSRHFRQVTKNIYRFLPVRMDNSTLDGMHGANERVGVKDFMESIKFYQELIMRLR